MAEVGLLVHGQCELTPSKTVKTSATSVEFSELASNTKYCVVICPENKVGPAKYMDAYPGKIQVSTTPHSETVCCC